MGVHREDQVEKLLSEKVAGREEGGGRKKNERMKVYKHTSPLRSSFFFLHVGKNITLRDCRRRRHRAAIRSLAV